jgi:hypothetical protein
MTATKENPEIITLSTLHSNGLKEEHLFRHLIMRGVHVNYFVHHEIMDPTSYVNESITNKVEYHPVVIPAKYFVDQSISLCDDNKWFIPEDCIYKQAEDLGLITPPEELASLIATDLPFNYSGLLDLKDLVIMSEQKDGKDQMTVSLKHIPSQNNPKTHLDTVWKNTFQEVGHIHVWKSGLVFIKKNK